MYNAHMKYEEKKVRMMKSGRMKSLPYIKYENREILGKIGMESRRTK